MSHCHFYIVFQEVKTLKCYLKYLQNFSGPCRIIYRNVYYITDTRAVAFMWFSNGLTASFAFRGSWTSDKPPLLSQWLPQLLSYLWFAWNIRTMRHWTRPSVWKCSPRITHTRNPAPVLWKHLAEYLVRVTVFLKWSLRWPPLSRREEEEEGEERVAWARLAWRSTVPSYSS